MKKRQSEFLGRVGRKNFISINALLLIVNLMVFAIVARHPERIAMPDEYSTIAQNIAFSGKYTRYPVPFPEREIEQTGNYMKWVDRSSEPDSIRVPGYPFFLSLFYRFFGYEKRIPVFAQMLIRLAVVNLALLTFYKVFNPQMTILFGIASALDISSTVYTYYLTSEILFTFFLIASVLFYGKFLETENKTNLFFSFILSGISILVRAVAVFSPFILLVAAIFKDRKGTLKICASFIIALSLTVGPWVYRNYRIFNVPGLTAVAGFNMFYYNAVGAYMMKNPGSGYEEAEPALEDKYAYVLKSKNFINKNSFEKSVILGKLGKEYIMENKLSYAKAHFKGIVLSFPQIAGPIMLLLTGKFRGTGIFASFLFRNQTMGRDFSLSVLFGLYNLLLVFLYLMAIRGFLNLVSKRREYNNLNYLVFFTMMYLILLPGPVGLCSFDRFRVPVMPFILFLSAYGLFGNRREGSVIVQDHCEAK